MAHKGVDDLQKEVQEQKDAVASGVALAKGFVSLLEAAGNDPSKLEDLRSALRNSQQALGEAVTAGTDFPRSQAARDKQEEAEAESARHSGETFAQKRAREEAAFRAAEVKEKEKEEPRKR